MHEITTLDVAEVLKSVWEAKPEVAGKLNPAIRWVFDRARVMLKAKHNIQMLENPANWVDLKAQGFSRPKELSRGRHPSLPYPRMKSFVQALRARDAAAARALEFLILTNVRTDTALRAEWRELDLVGAVWSIPPPARSAHQLLQNGAPCSAEPRFGIPGGRRWSHGRDARRPIRMLE